MIQPAIRLKGFTETWIESELSVYSSPYFVSNKLRHHQNLLSLSYGQIKRKDIKSQKGLLPASFDTYQVIDNGIIVFRFTDLQNDHKSLRVAIAKEEGIISPAYICIKSKDILPDFLYLQLYAYDLRKIFYKMGDGMRQCLSYNDVRKLPLFVPSPKEQKAIVEFFTALDNEISSLQDKLDKIIDIKSASLQSMFPQEGNLLPKARFKGFEEEWKEAELGELFQERNESDINGEMLSVTMNNGIIKASENGRYDNSNSDKSKYKVVRVNDIAYNSMRMWQGANGCSQYDGIVSPAYTVLVSRENVHSQFFAYLFKTDMALRLFKLNSQGLTSDNWNLKYQTLSKIKVFYPTNIAEQQKIADYFENLDKQLSLQTQRLEKLKRIKTSCLDKMFV